MAAFVKSALRRNARSPAARVQAREQSPGGPAGRPHSLGRDRRWPKYARAITRGAKLETRGHRAIRGQIDFL